MGVVLPHGGFVADVYKQMGLNWIAGEPLRLEANGFDGAFAPERSTLGHFHLDRSVLPFSAKSQT